MGWEKGEKVMKNGQLKVVTVLIVLGVTLGLLLFAQKYYNSSFVERPVIKALQEIKFVDNVNVSKLEDVYYFKVQIKQVGNIQYEYNKVNDVIKDNIKGKDYQLDVGSKPNEKLQNELEYLELSIYEAMAKNNYIWLDEIFRQAAKQDSFTYKLFIDEQRLYIQLADQDHFLYEVIERSTPVNSPDKGAN